MLVFLALIYFITLNVIYYFTNKTAKYDLSPRIEKLLGGKPKEALAAEKQAYIRCLVTTRHSASSELPHNRGINYPQFQCRYRFGS